MLCTHPCQYFSFENDKWKYITNVFGVFFVYILSTFLVDPSYRTWKDGEFPFFTHEYNVSFIFRQLHAVIPLKFLLP